MVHLMQKPMVAAYKVTSSWLYNRRRCPKVSFLAVYALPALLLLAACVPPAAQTESPLRAQACSSDGDVTATTPRYRVARLSTTHRLSLSNLQTEPAVSSDCLGTRNAPFYTMRLARPATSPTAAHRLLKALLLLHTSATFATTATKSKLQAFCLIRTH
jgi:hypothetical protein